MAQTAVKGAYLWRVKPNTALGETWYVLSSCSARMLLAIYGIFRANIHGYRLSQSILLMTSLTQCSNEWKKTEHVLVIYPAFLYTFSNTYMLPMILLELHCADAGY